MNKNKEAIAIIENAIAELYRGYFKLRMNRKYQEEYDSMGSLINMLSVDRQNIRIKYKIDA